MGRSKKIFILLAILFLLLLAFIAYDFSRKTQFPGSGKSVQKDTTAPEHDSVQSNH